MLDELGIFGIEQIANHIFLLDSQVVVEDFLVEQHLQDVLVLASVVKFILLARLQLKQHGMVRTQQVESSLQAQCLAEKRWLEYDGKSLLVLPVFHHLLSHLMYVLELSFGFLKETGINALRCAETEHLVAKQLLDARVVVHVGRIHTVIQKLIRYVA